jgi:hypothetical protein
MLDALLALIRLGRIEAAIPQDEKRGSKLMTVWLRVFGGFERAVYPTRIVSAKIEATILQDGHVQSVVRGASFNCPEYAWRPVNSHAWRRYRGRAVGYAYEDCNI